MGCRLENLTFATRRQLQPPLSPAFLWNPYSLHFSGFRRWSGHGTQSYPSSVHC